MSRQPLDKMIFSHQKSVTQVSTRPNAHNQLLSD